MNKLFFSAGVIILSFSLIIVNLPYIEANEISDGSIPLFAMRSTWDDNPNENGWIIEMSTWYADVYSKLDDIKYESQYADNLVLVLDTEASSSDILYAAGGFGDSMSNPVSIVFYVGHGGFTRAYVSGPPAVNPYSVVDPIITPEAYVYDFFITVSDGSCVADDQIWSRSGTIYGSLVFLWSCYQGLIPQDSYDAINTVNNMPTAWLHTYDFSRDGYNSPDHTTKAYIGFVNGAPFATSDNYYHPRKKTYYLWDSDGYIIGTFTAYSDITAFVYSFYYYFLAEGLPVATCLDLASVTAFNLDPSIEDPFTNTPIYVTNGIRLYGDGSFSIIHLWAISNYSDDNIPPGGV